MVEVKTKTQEQILRHKNKDEFSIWYKNMVKNTNGFEYTYTVNAVETTPEIAQYLLSMKGYKNRGGADGVAANVNRIANMILSGKWCKRSGEAVQIDETGHVIDAGTRLNAIRKSNQTLVIPFTFNAMQHPYKDSTMRRTFPQNMEIITGFDYDARWWSTLNIVWRMWKGFETTSCPHKTLPDIDHRIYHDYLRDTFAWCDSVFDSFYNPKRAGAVKKNDVHRAILLILALISEDEDYRTAVRDAMHIIMLGSHAKQNTFDEDSIEYKRLAEIWDEFLRNNAMMRTNCATHEGKNDIILWCVGDILSSIKNKKRRMDNRNNGYSNTKKLIAPVLDELFAITENDLDEKYQGILDEFNL